MEVEYYLYLEPFTYVDMLNDQVLLYNTLSGANQTFCSQEIVDFFTKINMQDNYGEYIEIDSIKKDKEWMRLVKWIRDSFSGDLLCLKNKYNPYILKPYFKNLDRDDLKEDKTLDIIFYINSHCSFNCHYCKKYYRQFLFCKSNSKNHELDKESMLTFIHKISIHRISSISFLGEHLINFISDKKITDFINHADCEIILYFNIMNLMNIDLSALANFKFKIAILVNEYYDINLLILFDKKISKLNLDYTYHMAIDRELNIPNSIEDKIILHPFYNGGNMLFFKNNVFTDLKDFENCKLSMRELYNKSIINTFYYGRLIVDSDGLIYTSFNNFASIGNISDSNIEYLLNKSFSNNHLWYLLRKNIPICSSCIYQNICPPISDYELFINRFNLCHINPF